MIPLFVSALFGCTAAPLDDGFDGGPAFTLSGEVAPGVAASGAETRGAVAYAWTAEGSYGTMVVEADFEARIWAYALAVPPPPPPTGASPELPELRTTGALSVLIGLPFLYAQPSGAPPAAFHVDGGALLARASGGGAVPVVAEPGATVVAFADRHLIGLYSGAASQLGDDAGFAGSCALQALLPGLTLYRDEGEAADTGASGACGRFQALSAPGERLEFQGVRMIAP